MCDYSLVALRTRLAVDGEELVTHRFPTGSLGLTTPAELEVHRPGNGWWSSLDPAKVACAVCIPPGSRLFLRDIPERLQQRLGIGPEEQVVFTQMSAEPGRYRDGVRFSNGQEILLQRLAEGQHARVVCLQPDEAEEELADLVPVLRVNRTLP